MATEKRLIYANEVSERADEVTFMGFMAKDRKQQLLDLVSAILEHIPTVDAVEVVHGRWKYYHKQNIAVCTNCSFERDLDANFGRAVSCPNCGAKMDLKGE